MPDSPKKILIVITEGVVGGAQTFAYNLARGLKKRGAMVTVGFGRGDHLAAQLAAAGIPVVRFRRLTRSNNPFANIPFIFGLRHFLIKEHYDAVQFNSTNSLFGALGAKWADRSIRTIFTAHGLSVLDPHYPASPALRLLYRFFFQFFLKFVDVPVFVAEHDLAEARTMGLTTRGMVIYNGIDTAALGFMEKDAARNALAERLGHDLSKAYILGSIGRLSYQKNYGFLIDVFKDILAAKPNAIAIIIGDGPERARCEAAIRTLELHEKIFLVGEMGDAAKYLKAFDLFVLPSRYEGLPITLTECMYAGVPMIASDVGGNREATGFRSLYRLDDREDFLKKFSEALKDTSGFIPDAAKKSQFSMSAMLDRYEALFKNG